MEGRRLVIGDRHGSLKALEQVGFDRDEDKLCFTATSPTTALMSMSASASLSHCLISTLS